MSRSPRGFEYRLFGAEVVISHHGRRATTLRREAARSFLAAVDDGDDAQELMARATGNYKHGNERVTKSHPRNRGR